MPLVMYRGSQGIEILLGPKNCGLWPTKTARNAEITSFDDADSVVYRGSQGIEILPGPENRKL